MWNDLMGLIIIIIGGLCLCHSTYIPINGYWKCLFLILGVILIAEGIYFTKKGE
jgi:hypothetical protein